MEKYIVIPTEKDVFWAEEVSLWTLDASKNGVMMPNGEMKPSMLPKSPDQVLGLFAQGLSVVVKADGMIVAHAGITFEWPENWMELGAVVTKKKYRRQGFANMAVLALLGRMKYFYPEKKLFALCNSLSLPLFTGLGGQITDGKELPEQVWGECVNCSNFQKARAAGKICCDTPVNMTAVNMQ